MRVVGYVPKSILYVVLNFLPSILGNPHDHIWIFRQAFPSRWHFCACDLVPTPVDWGSASQMSTCQFQSGFVVLTISLFPFPTVQLLGNLYYGSTISTCFLSHRASRANHWRISQETYKFLFFLTISNYSQLFWNFTVLTIWFYCRAGQEWTSHQWRPY